MEKGLGKKIEESECSVEEGWKDQERGRYVWLHVSGITDSQAHEILYNRNARSSGRQYSNMPQCIWNHIYMMPIGTKLRVWVTCGYLGHGKGGPFIERVIDNEDYLCFQRLVLIFIPHVQNQEEVSRYASGFVRLEREQ